MNKNIDLHIHTTCSDGLLTPKEVIDTSKRNQVFTIAIADHDTVEAYTENLFKYAKENEINLIPAVEISTRYKGFGYHVLGYNIDLKNTDLLKCLSMLKNARLDYLINVSRALNQIGYFLDVDKLKKLPTITKAHIALDIISNSRNQELLLKTFNHVPSKGEFIEKIMNEGCPAFIEKFSITPIEASKVIKNAHGKVILAHPVAYIHEDNIEVSQITDLIKNMKADGIEANYLYIDRNGRLFNESDFWNNYAKENNLITTIGSDFHNIDGIHPEIGFNNTKFNLRKEEINLILKNLLD